MMSGKSHRIDLDDYRGEIDLYRTAAEVAKQMVGESLRGFVHGVQDIHARAKDPDSAMEKLSRNGGGPINDLIGVRVVMLYDSAVQSVVDRLEKVFRNRKDLAKDKTSELSEGRVGYRGKHIYLQLKPSSIVLPEVNASKLQDILVEVQVKSLAAHTWAQAEHSLRYKAGNVPVEISRRFDYLAGSLALVDRELSNIEADLINYIDQLSVDFSSGRKLDSAMSAVELLALLASCRPKMSALGPQGLKLDVEDAFRLAKGLNNSGLTTVGKAKDIFLRDRTNSALLNYLEMTEDGTDPEEISGVIYLAAVMGQVDPDVLLSSTFFGQESDLPERMAQAIASESDEAS